MLKVQAAQKFRSAPNPRSRYLNVKQAPSNGACFCVTISGMVVVCLIILGLVLGSFSNAAIWRLHMQQSGKRQAKRLGLSDRDLSIATGRSVCTRCGHQLSTLDLIPVISYLLLRGKCRYCHKPIEDTPLLELALPILFVVSYIWWPYDLTTPSLSFGQVLFGIWLLALVGFVVLAVYDTRWLLLPDRVVFPLIALAAASVIVQATVFHGGLASLATAAWGVLLTAGVFYILYVVSRGAWIGFGDVKLAIVLGLFVGGPVPALLLIFIASLAGSLAAIPLLLRGKSVRATRIPFGPFLLLATAIVMLFGTVLSDWYIGLLIR